MDSRAKMDELIRVRAPGWLVEAGWREAEQRAISFSAWVRATLAAAIQDGNGAKRKDSNGDDNR